MMSRRDSTTDRTKVAPWILAGFFTLQGFVAAFAADFDWQAFLVDIQGVDSSWYLHLAQKGYVRPEWTTLVMREGSQYAFFPLWPMILGIVANLVSTPYLALFGMLIAGGLFATVVRSAAYRDASPAGLFALAFAPGAWVFFSNHTEALFLFLSFFAFAFATDRRYWLAALVAGLATLTRNQGIIVAVTTGLIALSHPGALKDRIRNFSVIGIISAAFFLCWLFYQYQRTGTFFASAAAQENWYMTRSLREYLTNFFWLSPNQMYRAAIFWAVLIVGGRMIAKPTFTEARAIGAYLVLSAMLWPLQGNNFPQAYRFSAVLFPFWFFLGDVVSKRLERMERRGIRIAMTAAIAILLIAGSLTMSWRFYHYTDNNWPY